MLIAGCQRDCREDDDDDADSGVEEDFYDPDGQRDGGGLNDGGRPRDGGSPSDAGGLTDGGGMDAGGPADAGGPMDGGPSDVGRDGGGLDGGAIDGEVACPGPKPSMTGTANAPRKISIGSLPYSGRVEWRGLAFIEVTGLTAGREHVVALEGADGLMLLTYPDDSAFATATCSDYPVPDQPAMCVVTPSSSSLYIAIDADRDSESFVLDVAPMPENEAPDITSPVAFDLPSLPATVTAIPGAPSYYAITGLTAGRQYVVSAEGAEEIINFSVRTEPTAAPVDIQVGTAPELVATPRGPALFLSVMGSRRGTSLELNVSTTSYVSEGDFDAPLTVPASSLPLIGEVPATSSLAGNPWDFGRSTYAISEMMPGDYVLRMAAEPGIVLVVFSDEVGLSIEPTPTCVAWVNEGDSFAECSAHVTGSSLSFAAVNVGGDGSALSFELDEPVFESQGGPLARVEVPAGDGAIVGTVAGMVSSYYRLMDVKPRRKYRFAVADAPDAELQVIVHEPGHADQPKCFFAESDPTLNACVVETNIAQLDVQVAATLDSSRNRNIGTAFELEVELLPEQTRGTQTDPETIGCGVDAHHGTVGSDGSVFYEIEGLTAGANYIVELSGASGTYDLTVSTEPDTFVSPCWHGDAVGTPGRCKSKASSDGKLFVRVRSGVIISFDLRVHAAMSGSEGTAAAPFVIARSKTPYVGRAASAAPSYYEVRGLTRDRLYGVRVVSEQETTVLRIWPSGFGGTAQYILTTSPGFPNETSFLASGTSAFITVDVAPQTDGATSFSLEVIPYD